MSDYAALIRLTRDRSHSVKWPWEEVVACFESIRSPLASYCA